MFRLSRQFTKINILGVFLLNKMEDKSEKFRTCLLSNVSLKGLEEHVLCLPRNQGVVQMVAYQLWELGVMGSNPISLKCYGVCNVMVLACQCVVLKERVQFPPFPYHPLPEQLLGESAKLFFMGAIPIGMSKNIGIQFSWVEQLSDMEEVIGSNPVMPIFSLRKTLYLESFLAHNSILCKSFIIAKSLSSIEMLSLFATHLNLIVKSSKQLESVIN